ncbi:MAG: anti-sigma factor family protein [Desulfocucumaceae bacterium]
MTENTRCNDIRDLFSLWLDGELPAEESHLLTGHLLECDPCRREFELWQKISETLKSDSPAGEPSPDFCAGVMGRIQSEVEAAPGRRLMRFWRTPAAAAAAAVMLFAGSWGVSVALKSDKPESAIVINQPAAEIGKGPVASADPQITKQPVDGSTVSGPGTTAGDPADSNAAVPGSPAAPAGSQKSGSIVKDTVLLNSQRDILGTILKLAVTNTGDTANTVLAMASSKGGSGQVLTTQKKGQGELVIVRVAIPREIGRSMVAQLSGLGGIMDRVDERRDISDNYNQAVNRLNEIRALMKTEAEAGEIDQLEAEASVLKRQIEAWDNEAASYVIMLWLEH